MHCLAALRPAATMPVASRAGVVRLVLGFGLLTLGGLLLTAGAVEYEVYVGVAGGMLSFLGVLAIAVGNAALMDSAARHAARTAPATALATD